MLKYLFLIIVFCFTSVSAEESLLTLKQQIDRLQREVNDLSKIVFQNEVHVSTEIKDDQDLANISAFLASDFPLATSQSLSGLADNGI